MKKSLETISSEDGRYKVAGFKFVYEGLGFTVKRYYGEPGHVSGQKLAEGLGELAIEKWGMLAGLVLLEWGIKSTADFGEIVYLMIKNQLMSAQPTDSKSDFLEVYEFEKFLKANFKF
ncbi:MAG: hypothetical protein ISS77_02895 [Phycisphaerae bacterium]|nr:hypothetical protein [Phycisphaerae bacterium]